MDAELVARTFVELTNALPSGAGIDRFTRMIVDGVTELVRADSAFILLTTREGVAATLASSSSRRAHDLGTAQLSLGDGPCLDALRDGVAARYPDGMRWPTLALEVSTASPLALDAIPLHRDDVAGVLGIIHTGSTGLDAEMLKTATAIADLAAISIARHGRSRTGQRHARRLRSTLDVLIVVEQAKGVLAERTGTDIDTAHRLMQDYAHVQNESLGGIARRVVGDAGKTT